MECKVAIDNVIKILNLFFNFNNSISILFLNNTRQKFTNNFTFSLRWFVDYDRNLLRHSYTLKNIFFPSKYRWHHNIDNQRLSLVLVLFFQIVGKCHCQVFFNFIFIGYKINFFAHFKDKSIQHGVIEWIFWAFLTN